MSSEHRVARKIFVGDILCGSLREAASTLRVPEPTLYRRLRLFGECVVNGTRVCEAPPGECTGPDISPGDNPAPAGPGEAAGTEGKNLSGRARRPAIAFYECVARNDTDGVLMPVYASPLREHRRGEPLLRYPLGEDPLDRGIYVYH